MNADKSSVDLGLALCLSNDFIQPTRNYSPGAGVNAGSTTDMAFVSSDYLSELVWSPQNGLQLKHAGNVLTSSKPGLPWDVGPSHLVFSPSHSILSIGTRGCKPIEEGNSVASQMAVCVDSDGAGSLPKSPTSCSCPLLGTTNDCTGREDQRNDPLPLLDNGPLPDKKLTELSSGNFKEENSFDNKNKDLRKECQSLALDICLVSKVHNQEHQAFENPFPNSAQSSGMKQMELTLVREEERDEKKNNSMIIEKPESTAENDVEKLITKPESTLVEYSSSARRIRPYQSKCKGKITASMSNNKVSDNEASKSMESCNSGNLGKRRSADRQLIFRSESFKKRTDHRPSSTSMNKRDSSFMNWISNMVKGYENISPGKMCNLGKRATGFQNIFESLYCPEAKVPDASIPVDVYNAHGSKESILASVPHYINVLPLEKKDMAYEIEANGGANTSNFSHGMAKYNKENSLDPASNICNTSYPSGSLWITRFCGKSPVTENVVNDTGNELPSRARNIGFKIIGMSKYRKPYKEKSSESPKSSENLALLFARRLDTIKQSSSALDTKENGLEVAGVCYPRKDQTGGNITFTSEILGKIIQDDVSLRLGEKLTNKKLIPFCNLTSGQLLDAPRGMFDAITRLRLSRKCILKCMSTQKSVSCLDGFFVRLRLGSSVKGIGDAGYYVACITGMQEQKSLESPEKSIRVSIGSIKLLVESQYISNHDFLEDELVAWWHEATRNGHILTEHGLKSKLEEREKLGW